MLSSTLATTPGTVWGEIRKSIAIDSEAIDLTSDSGYHGGRTASR